MDKFYDNVKSKAQISGTSTQSQARSTAFHFLVEILQIIGPAGITGGKVASSGLSFFVGLCCTAFAKSLA